MTTPEKRKPAPAKGRPRDTTAHRSERRPDASAPADGQLDLFAGRDQAEENTDQWWADTAMTALTTIASTGVEFQCYDLVEQFGLTEPDIGKRWGALFGKAARTGVIVAVGVTRSRRPSACGALTRVWRGAA
ncbi:MAG: hypothetical protein L0I76_20110 [Pseudonocardia sp.]|nr:hypothetical protein [Pseudonocardia sp.]